MPGEANLERLLATMDPELSPGDYLFCLVEGGLSDLGSWNPWALIHETEGWTIIAEAEEAQKRGFGGPSFRRITLRVHSSLQAVGLTAAVATRLAAEGISANVVAAFYHDHVFVPSEHADRAIAALRELAGR